MKIKQKSSMEVLLFNNAEDEVVYQAPLSAEPSPSACGVAPHPCVLQSFKCGKIPCLLLASTVCFMDSDGRVKLAALFNNYADQVDRFLTRKTPIHSEALAGKTRDCSPRELREFVERMRSWVAMLLTSARAEPAIDDRSMLDFMFDRN